MASLTQKDLGEALGLETDKNISLWKDRVALELNYAILQSFQVAGATIVDQFTVSDQFQTHMKNEMRERGGCPAGVLTSIFIYHNMCPYSYHMGTNPSYKNSVDRFDSILAAPPSK